MRKTLLVLFLVAAGSGQAGQPGEAVANARSGSAAVAPGGEKRFDETSADAVVDVRFSGQPGAVFNGRPHFATIGQALAAAPAGAAPYRLFVRQGRYYERVTVTRPNLIIQGGGREETLLTFDACSDTRNPAGGTLGTWGCATLMVRAPGFAASDLTIENGFDYPGNARKPEEDSTRIRNAQAVAMMLAEGSDEAVFRRCIIRGFQDTLFPNAGRSCFDSCRILGHVDFIFGAGQALFSGCDIVSRDRPGKNPAGYITAPSTLASYPYGFLFLRCRLLKESPEMAAGSVRLGRPWHPHADPAVSGSAVFVACYMEDHLGTEGYAEISSSDSTGKKIIYAVGPDSRFFEYGSYGPGALITAQRPQLTAAAAAWYTPEQLLRGWQP
ncbi:MAG TPA: pectinesterase family protein [bacterium]|nr:pectinesterase family protein [bacterium]HPR89040.1 pectinesterase family protein [bacterium]